jgi:ParB family chromosome partitioning protein
MTDEGGRRRLGRGLAALIGDVAGDTAGAPEPDRGRGQRRLPVAIIAPSRFNPRRAFGEEELGELAASIREHGLIQPILVRPAQGSTADRYEIVAGERRWRAAQMAGLHDVPVVVRQFDDRESLEIAVVENVQRSDLTALEEAMGYEVLISTFGYSQGDLAKTIGKSRSHVANTLRLLKLPDAVKEHVTEGRLTAGHARALLTAADPEGLAERIIAEGLTVRDAERLAAEPVAGAVRRAAKAVAAKDADTRALEQRLAGRLGLAVAISHKPSGAGELKLRYSSLEQLDAICRMLGEG